MKNIDRYNLREVILAEAEQFAQGFAAAAKIDLPLGRLGRVMVSGIGGSALPANILRVYLNSVFAENPHYRKIDVYQNRFYTLPPEAYENCLNLICSHSGNTEETLSSFREVLANNLPAVAVSAGGEVEKLARENNIPHIRLPLPGKNFQPRMATGHFVSAMIEVLVRMRMIPDCRAEIAAAADKLREEIPAMENPGRELAEKLSGSTPLIYSSARFKALAMIWKIKINENSKTPAFWNFFPELNHNEFVGFTLPQARFFVLMLRDGQDHPDNLRRFQVTADFLRQKDIPCEIVDIPEGESVFYRMFASLALADWTSYYLALSYGQDPTPVDMVEDFKKALRKN